MPFLDQVVREGALDLLPVHLPSQPGDLPGDLTAPSVLIVNQDVRNDFDTNRSIQGISDHWRPSLSPVDSVGQHPIPAKGQVSVPLGHFER